MRRLSKSLLHRAVSLTVRLKFLPRSRPPRIALDLVIGLARLADSPTFNAVQPVSAALSPRSVLLRTPWDLLTAMVPHL